MSGEFTAYADRLSAIDRKDDGAFQRLLNDGMLLLSLNDKDIAHQFGVSRPTVARWRNGDISPHPEMRPIVYAFLEGRAKQHEIAAPARPIPTAAYWLTAFVAIALLVAVCLGDELVTEAARVVDWVAEKAWRAVEATGGKAATTTRGKP